MGSGFWSDEKFIHKVKQILSQKINIIFFDELEFKLLRQFKKIDDEFLSFNFRQKNEQ